MMMMTIIFTSERLHYSRSLTKYMYVGKLCCLLSLFYDCLLWMQQTLQQWREEGESQQELRETVSALTAQLQSISAQLDEVKTLLHDHIRH